MLKLTFSEEEINQLRYEHLHHEHPRVRRRCEVVYLKSLEFSHQNIGRLVGISQPTLRSYLEMYKNGGIEKLKELNFYRPVSQLEAHREKLKAEFTSTPPKSVNEAMKRIEKLTGILRSPTQVRQFIKRLGLKRLKAGQIPVAQLLIRFSSPKASTLSPFLSGPQMPTRFLNAGFALSAKNV